MLLTLHNTQYHMLCENNMMMLMMMIMIMLMVGDDNNDNNDAHYDFHKNIMIMF